MPLFHAVVRIDHHTAQLLQFDPTQVISQTLKAHSHPTKQHGSAVRAEHEFFGQVCDALAGITEVLAVGPKTGLADFRHYVEKHRHALLPHILAWETIAHPTTPQLVALARQVFLKLDRMNGLPTPT